MLAQEWDDDSNIHFELDEIKLAVNEQDDFFNFDFSSYVSLTDIMNRK